VKTIVTLSQKGGAGKTALTLNLAVAAQKAGFKVGVIDVDPQQSSAEWGDQRAEVTDEGPSVIGGHAKGLPKLLATASDGGADFVFIDSPPGKNDAHLEMARLADLILVPCRPSVVDIRAITATAEIGTLAGKQVWVVFNPDFSHWHKG
jgi:chromosome partitioning protein